MKYIKLFISITTLFSMLSLATVAADSPTTSPTLAPIKSLSTASTFKQEVCGGLNSVTAISCSKNATTNTFTNIAREVVNIMSFFVGSISVIMVIIAGFKYIISSGDSNAVASAKNTLIYALVGLAIAILAQILVHSVLNSASNAVGSITSSQLRDDS